MAIFLAGQGLIVDRWEQMKDGNGQVVLLSGEAGIGKSRLIQALQDHKGNGGKTRVIPIDEMQEDAEHLLN